MNVLAIRFSGNAKQFQGFLDFCEAYGDMTVKELIERKFLLA
jgi:hypothetical protein